MKLSTPSFVFLVSVAWAQTPTAPIVIKGGQGDCFLVAFLRFSPDGRELVRGCASGPVAMFDTKTYRRARTFLPEIEHTPELTDLAYSPDGRIIATTRGWGGTFIWNAADPGKPVGGKTAAFLGVDELYALDTPMRTLEPPVLGGRVGSVSFSPDGKLLLTAYADGNVKIWTTSSWAVLEKVAVTDGDLSGLAVAPDSKSVMIGGANGVLHQWGLTTKTEIRRLRTSGRILLDLEFSPDGKTFVAILQGKTFADGSAMIWNTKDWTPQTESGYSSAAFSPDGKLLALGGRGHIKLIEPDSQKEIRDIKLPEITMTELLPSYANQPDAEKKVPSIALALAFSPDGKKLAAGDAGGLVRLLSVNP